MGNLRTQEEIMSSWKGNINKPLVTIRCMTYNHELYIEDALRGFLIQETSFPFEILIHDDASMDNTANLVRKYEQKYPLIIKGWYQEINTYNLSGEARNAKRKPYFDLTSGKYIAICEGDDYWTDPNKLQLQVDFLEKNPEYGMCYTKVQKYDQLKKEMLIKKAGRKVVTYRSLFKRVASIPTLTTCFRRSCYEEYLIEINPSKKGWLMGDLPLWLYFIIKTKIYFFNTVTGVYRILEESASHTKNFEKKKKFDQSVFDIWFYFSQHYNLKITLYYWLNKREAIKGYRNINVPIRFKIFRFLAKNPYSFRIATFFVKAYHKMLQIVGNRFDCVGGL